MAMEEVKAPVTRESPGRHSFPIVPHDTADVNPGGISPRCLYVGTGGTIIGSLVGDDGALRPYLNVQSGSTLAFEFQCIHTDSTAKDILGIY